MVCCENCVFWELDERVHGICSKAEFCPDGDWDEFVIVIKDASCYDATLYTRKDHCCKEFKKKS